MQRETVAEICDPNPIINRGSPSQKNSLVSAGRDPGALHGSDLCEVRPRQLMTCSHLTLDGLATT